MSLAGTFNPTNGTYVQVTTTPASIALPGGSATAISVVNVGDDVAFVQLGGSAVVASQSNGVCVPPRVSPIYLAGGTNTYIGYVAQHTSTGLSISVGS